MLEDFGPQLLMGQDRVQVLSDQLVGEVVGRVPILAEGEDSQEALLDLG